MGALLFGMLLSGAAEPTLFHGKEAEVQGGGRWGRAQGGLTGHLLWPFFYRRFLTAVLAQVFSTRREILIFLQQLSFVHMLADLTRKIRLAAMAT